MTFEELYALDIVDLVDLAWPAYRDLGISKSMLQGEPRINLVQAVLALEAKS
jgi:hypothetical protein